MGGARRNRAISTCRLKSLGSSRGLSTTEGGLSRQDLQAIRHLPATDVERLAGLTVRYLSGERPTVVPILPRIRPATQEPSQRIGAPGKLVGRRLFRENGAMAQLQLVAANMTTKGVIVATYWPA
jgi:hypothetical protein